MTINTDPMKNFTDVIAACESSDPCLVRVPDENLHTEFKSLVEKTQPLLKGEYQPYTIYQKNKSDVYSLIYADYNEADGVYIDDIQAISMVDGNLMHQKLKDSGLAIDYLFIVIYYNYIDRVKGSICFNGDAIVTKDF